MVTVDVHWIEQSDFDVPSETGWLSAHEIECLNGKRFPKRRADWRLGRWTAKLAVARILQLPEDASSLAEIEVHATCSGAPEVFVASHPAPITISLSHSAGHCVSAVADRNVQLGCDIETLESRSQAFVADYFTHEEQAQIAHGGSKRDLLVALMWSAKESAMKALQTGLRVDTRSVKVESVVGQSDIRRDAESRLSTSPGRWHPLRVRGVDHHPFEGWWCHDSQFVRTLVAAPAPSRPILIERSSVPLPSTALRE